MRFPYKPRHADLRLDLTPLVDVIFLLIIFFLVTSSFVEMTGIAIQLPSMSTTTKLEDLQSIIEIDQEGRYFFDAKQISPKALEEQLSTLKQDSSLMLRADKRVPFEKVMHVWDLAKSNKLEKITVMSLDG